MQSDLAELNITPDWFNLAADGLAWGQYIVSRWDLILTRNRLLMTIMMMMMMVMCKVFLKAHAETLLSSQAAITTKLLKLCHDSAG